MNGVRQKTRNLRRDPRCSFTIVDLANPYRYVELRGEADVDIDADRSFAAQVGAKYHADLSDHDGPDDERYVVTIRPATVHAPDMSG